MQRGFHHGLLVVMLATAFAWGGGSEPAAQTNAADRLGCEALRNIRNLTITAAELFDGADGGHYCYVKGILPPAIQFHVQLPLPRNWNGRFLQWGDGGKDGDLDFADHRVREGYAVANSNTGHDNDPANWVADNFTCR